MVYSAYQNTHQGFGGVSVVSSGHIFAPRNRRIHRPNGRKDFLLFYVAKGSEYMLLDREVVMTEGSFVIFRPDEKQIHMQKDCLVSEFYYIHFHAPEDFNLSPFESSRVYTVAPSAQIHDLFEEVIAELQNKRPAYEKVCVSKLFGLLALLERKNTKETTPLGQYADRICLVIQQMNREYEKDCALEDYAKMCCMDKYHFSRVFKKMTGFSPIAYRNNIRIEHARELLTDTEDTIEQICASVGYASNVYFCDAFKRKVGLSPTQYRKTHP